MSVINDIRIKPNNKLLVDDFFPIYAVTCTDSIKPIDKKIGRINEYKVYFELGVTFGADSESLPYASDNAKRMLVNHIYKDIYKISRRLVDAVYSGDRN